MIESNTASYAHFVAKLALFKCNFLRDAKEKSTNSCAHKKAENMRNLKLTLLFSIASSKPEL